MFHFMVLSFGSGSDFIFHFISVVRLAHRLFLLCTKNYNNLSR